MIAYLVVAGAAAAALIWALVPFLRADEVRPEPGNRDLDDAEERKRAALGAILDLENELDAGKLAVEDHAALRREYEALAARALEDIDRASVDVEDPLEAEIAAARAALACGRCGARKPANEPCPRCGA